MASGEMAGSHLAVRHRLGADWLGERATRPQAAAAWNINWARDLAGEREGISLGLRIWLRHGSKQGAGVGMVRPVEQLGGLRFLDDDAEIHNRHARVEVAHRREI